jgi:poly-gamma-glutamate capsule biosynthesis protein CapA/YwtB (metallophosphatase superfamily)
MPTIGLLGDVMLGRSVAERLDSVEPADLWSEGLRERLAGCDAVVCNLECCISERGRRTTLIPGKPFFFRAPPAAVDALRAAGVSAVGLANNHALDYGPDALLDTLRLLAAGGIAAAGAGPDEASARAGVVIEAAGVRVGILALSDHPAEYAAAGSAPGVAYAELRRRLPAWVAEELERLRERCELVLAFPHWGPNMSVRPAAWQRDRARELLDAGADLVAGHSAHVFHGIEWRSGGVVAYDLGDALDDYRVDRRLRNDLGLLALWHPGAPQELELVGLALDFCHTREAEGADARWIESRLERACRELRG